MGKGLSCELSCTRTGVVIVYRKYSISWDTKNTYHNCHKNWTDCYYYSVMRSKYADEMANSADTDQTAPESV